MLRTGSPKRLWDHSLELKGAVRSHTCLDIYALDGQVPETVMMGQTNDISHLSEYEWLNWVMYSEPVNGYPNDRVTIGRYLGPASNVGSAMTMKILKPNGGYVCHSTVRPWTKVVEANPIHRGAPLSSIHTPCLALSFSWSWPSLHRWRGQGIVQ